MTEHENWGPLSGGVSLHCLSSSVTSEDLEMLGKSSVETLELYPPWLAAAPTPKLWEDLQALFQAGALRAATVHADFGGDLDLSSPHRGVREKGLNAVRQALEIAGECGAPLIVVHASAEPVTPEEREDRLARSLKSLGQAGQWAGEYGKKIALELLPRTCLGNTVSELLRLVGSLDPQRFGVCLDTNHLMERWASLPEEVKLLDHRLWTLHLSDYDGVDEKHWPPGQGVIDWKAFGEALRDIGYLGPFNYEANFPGETFAERLQALEENFRWMAAGAPSASS